MEESLTHKSDKRAVVLDTSAFLAGYDPFSIAEEQYTVPMVKKEIRENSMAWVRFKMAVENGKLKVRTPERIFVDKMEASAAFVGDVFFLSEVDLQVLALALELKMCGYSSVIATDDYSIQNVANQVGVKFTPLATFGIRFRLQWIRYCPACHRRYQADYKSRRCEVCGTELKRKPIEKKAT
ncbi:MAG: hypothetical protein OEZ40_05670 [Candidatus Bathyarchaeota archaeon]|nr:hypothetical protein [Candidatus Bathyarchaeota archaeon]